MINIQDMNKIIKLISDYSNCCLKCGSTNISNEDESDMITCNNCSHQFSEEEQMDKIMVVSFLRTVNQKEAAEQIKQLSANEFEKFIDDYIKE